MRNKTLVIKNQSYLKIIHIFLTIQLINFFQHPVSCLYMFKMQRKKKTLCLLNYSCFSKPMSSLKIYNLDSFKSRQLICRCGISQFVKIAINETKGLVTFSNKLPCDYTNPKRN